MYCLQWLIPVLLIPKPLNPALLHNHAMFLILYLTGFFLERKPCTICSIVFIAAVFLICYNCVGNCIFWGCPEEECGDTECTSVGIWRDVPAFQNWRNYTFILCWILFSFTDVENIFIQCMIKFLKFYQLWHKAATEMCATYFFFL